MSLCTGSGITCGRKALGGTMASYNVMETFGKRQFSERVMRERLPRPIFQAWQKAVHNETEIEREVADAIAHAMKVWAIELGATHYCHWFQPLNGKTAEKHDAFLMPGEDDAPIARLSGKALMRGETDGSSFPNGGLRDTFEARGYTFWDVTSSAFVREAVLYIPSVFISYHGDKIDMKLPLLNARQAMSAQATRVLHLLGSTEVKFVRAMVGLEQEYFLLNKEAADKRPDVVFCERVLFSADMPKGGDYEYTYFGSLSKRVQEYMNEVNRQCWELGIFASVEHNEVAPGQYEFSSIFDDVTVTVDQNMIVMDILKRVAEEFGFTCLLTEKPFGGMNGSGKHNNFSLEASNGDNLFDPGDRAPEDLQFILFLSAFIQAVDEYAPLLRLGSSSEGNDHRLGGHEAPPAIVSINLGEQLHALFEQLAKTTDITPVQLKRMTKPIISLSEQSIDATDRNRTSPVSFGGNKFEFRMLGSSMNASAINTFLLAGMAEALEKIADQLEAHKDEDLHETVIQIAHDIMEKHHRILFAGDGYKADWVEEAKRRGLPVYPHYIDSVSCLKDEKNIQLLERFDVLNRTEMNARYEVLVSHFIHAVKTQARTIGRMASQGVYPALVKYQITLGRASAYGLAPSIQRRAKINADFIESLDALVVSLDEILDEVIHQENRDDVVSGMLYRVRPAMDALRDLLQEIELHTPYDVFPYPTQVELIVQ